MKPTELMSTIKTCVQERRFAILKSLHTLGKMGYIDLLRYTGGGDSAKFSYHLRRLVKCKAVQRNIASQTYSIAERGITIMNLLENNLKKKYISDESGGICSNSEDANHTMITICTKCSYIKKEDRK